jgi:hypothetical protein
MKTKGLAITVGAAALAGGIGYLAARSPETVLKLGSLMGIQTSNGEGNALLGSRRENSCSADAVEGKVIEIVRSAVPYYLLLRASEAKARALNEEIKQKLLEQAHAAESMCTEQFADEIHSDLTEAGVPDVEFDSLASVDLCRGAGNSKLIECNTAVRPTMNKFQRCFDANKPRWTTAEHDQAQATSAANYSLSAIRTTSVDASVDSRKCTAILKAVLPSDWGAGEEEISYTVERTSDGGLYIKLLSGDKL